MLPFRLVLSSGIWICVALMLLLATCAPLPAHANSVKLIGAGYSYHGDRSKEHNEVHHNVGISVGDYALAYYYNSKHRDTIVFARNFMYGNDCWAVGAMVGVATGYSHTGDAQPAALLKAQGCIGRLGFELHHLPNGQDLAGVVTQLQFTYRTGFTVPDLELGKTPWRVAYTYGLLGGQVDLGYRLNERWNIRGTASTGTYSWEDTWQWDDASLWQKERFRVQQFSLLLDYRIAGNWWVYAGPTYNRMQYKTRYLATAPNGRGTIRIAGQDAQIYDGDTLSGIADWSKSTGTAGIRYSRPISTAWSFVLDTGVTYVSGVQGKAVYDSGHASPEEIAALEQPIQDWIDGPTVKQRYDKYNYVPHIRVGFEINF